MFITGIINNKIHQWDLSTAFDPSTKSGLVSASLNWSADAGTSSESSDVSDADGGDWLRGHAWSIDGSKLFVINWDGGLAGDSTPSYRIICYNVSTPFEISSISNSAPTSSTSIDTNVTNSVRSLALSSDGKKFFFIDRDAKAIFQWSLTTAYDLSTASTSSDASFYPGTWTTMRSLTFSPDGYKMFVGDAKNDKVNQYSLASPFDLSTTPDFDCLLYTSPSPRD